MALRPGGLQICVAVELDELLGGNLPFELLGMWEKQGKTWKAILFPYMSMIFHDYFH